MAATADPSTHTQEWTGYFNALKAQLTDKVGQVYGPVWPFASAETVNWFWGEPNPQGGGELYNAGTYDFLNTRIGLGASGALQPEGGALNLDIAGAYRNITFGYSAADKQTLTDNINNTVAQASLLVSTYQGLYGTITATQMATAQAKLPEGLVASPLDYIVDYVVRYQWAGVTPQTPQGAYNLGLDPYKTQDLGSKLAFMPASAAPVLSALAAYIAAAQPIAPLRDQLVNAMVPVSAVIAAVSTPSPANGAIQLVSPIDGSTARTGLGWSFKTSQADLGKSLGLSGGAGGGDLEISFAASYNDAETFDVSVSGGGAFEVPILDFLGISAGGSADYSSNSLVQEGDSLTITVTYPGLTVWEFVPERFDGTVGWYDSTPLQQAVANGVLQPDGTAATTGYALASASPYDWTSTSGTFGVLNGLVISRQPTVTIDFATSSASELHTKLTQSADVGVSIFGIDLFSSHESTTTTTDKQSATDGSFSMTIAPPAEQATGLQSLAWVVGAFVLWPGQGQA